MEIRLAIVQSCSLVEDCKTGHNPLTRLRLSGQARPQRRNGLEVVQSCGLAVLRSYSLVRFKNSNLSAIFPFAKNKFYGKF